MNSKMRFGILCLLALAFLAVYTSARRFSPFLVAFVVERALAEKAPQGMGSDEIAQRLEALLASASSEDEKLTLLLTISQRIEKVQRLTAGEMSRLLKIPLAHPAGIR